MADPLLGQIMPVGFNFAPRGWATCEGQLLPIAQNTALFSLLGTTFGGDGRTTFALPDLRGRTMVGVGNGPGLSHISLGERGGSETVTLTTANLPAHSHTATLNAERNVTVVANPQDKLLAGAQIYAAPATTVAMAAQAITVANAGGGQSFQNRSPFLGLYICIALQGTFPSRN